jgi:hypothetical protein
MKMKLLLTPFLMALFLVGCSTATESSDKVDQDSIHQSYSVSYDEAQDQTSAIAEFRFGDASGTTLSLKGNSKVTHNLFSLREMSLAGTMYTGDGSGLKAQHQFKFVDTNGKEYLNAIDIAPIAIPSSTPNTVRAGNDLVVKWDGSPLAQGESVTIYLRGTTQSLQLASVRQIGATSILLPKTDVAKAGRGPATLELKRARNTNLQNATKRGGSLNASYTTKKFSLTIAD